MTLPVLYIFFNRKDTVNFSLNAIRAYSPSIIYLACDGPRDFMHNENYVVQEIRNFVITNIDWPCEVHTFFRKQNLGCKVAVHEAIQWFFNNEEMGIVIEDDVIPTLNFFRFCEAALHHFKEEKYIGSVTGRNDMQEWGSDDCFASSRFHCWGWASWSDRILNLDVEYGYNLGIDYSCLYENCSWEERFYLKSVFGLLQTNQVDSWAYSYDLNFKKNKQLHIYPQKNMIKNIGFGPNGTHASYGGTDKINVYYDFSPSNFRTSFFINDQRFVKIVLKNEYGGYLLLFVMRYIRYLGWIRKLRKHVYKNFINHFSYFRIKN
jgi:hypothetical protein